MSGVATPDPSEGDHNLGPRRRRWREGLSDEARAWLERDEAVFYRQSLSTPCLDVLTRAEGAVIEDLDGRRFLDFHGNAVHQLGYAHPKVLAALREQLDRLSFCPRRFTNAPAVRLAETLCRLAPGGPRKVLFTPGGTTAVGLAQKLARVVTGRFKTLSLWGAFHGASLDAVSLSGEALFRAGAGPLLPGAGHVPPPDPWDCVFRPSGDCAACDLACARYVEYVLDHEGDVGLFMAEPVRATTAGAAPPGYWERVAGALARHGALLAMDETPTCLGRLGRFSASAAVGLDPDLMVLGKGLGGGVAPLAALIGRAEYDLAGHLALGHYTHEKSPLGAAAAQAAIDVTLAEDLPGRAARLGRHALDRLWDMVRRHDAAVAARGLGLLLALRLDRPEKAEAVLYGCLARGLSFKVSSGTVLTLVPPLTIAETDLDAALDILDAVLADA